MLLSVAADLAGNSDAAADACLVGLQTLIARDVARSRNVATRTMAASRRAVCCLGGGDPALFAGKEGGEEEGEEEEGGGEGEEEGGCWVLYGWRRRLRRLPPLIPSLRRAGRSPWALTRTRTADGRVVVSREPAPRRGRVFARKLDGRLILELVERDDSPVPPPPRHHPSIAQETDSRYRLPCSGAAVDEEATAERGSARRDVPTAAQAPMTSPVGSASPPPPPLPAAGCFEDVIRTASLCKMHVSLARMVH